VRACRSSSVAGWSPCLAGEPADVSVAPRPHTGRCVPLVPPVVAAEHFSTRLTR
jgi:hypothetical protein